MRLRSQTACGRKADAAIGTGHDGDFSLNLTHVFLLSFRLFATIRYRSFHYDVIIRFVYLSATDLLASTIPGVNSPFSYRGGFVAEEKVRPLLRDGDDGGVGVATNDRRHHRGISDTQPFSTENPEM